MGIANDITEIIGNTPLVRINKLAKKSKAKIVTNEEALETTQLLAKKRI